MPTADKIRNLIRDNEESAEPQTAILAYLRERNGKTLTARDLPKLQAIDPTIRLDKSAGMTHIEWGGYSRTGGRDGGSLLIGHTTGAPVIDASWIEEHNTAYFKAREERNAQRKAALEDDETIARVAAALDAIEAAHAVLEKLTGYGEPLNADGYAIKALIPLEIRTRRD